MQFIIRLLITGVVAFALSNWLAGVHMDGFSTAVIFALVLAVVNALIKPLLIILTLPITILTLGLFLFVINALIILLIDNMLDGVQVDGFWWALLFSLLLSIISTFLISLLDKDK
ncbi:MAG: phage holin family protein [Chitinophagaceae bacterium]|nr:MAG: phage holin family protein [Chitinophagaceae bacterium]